MSLLYSIYVFSLFFLSHPPPLSLSLSLSLSFPLSPSLPPSPSLPLSLFLQETAESRRQVLEDSYEAQKYFSDALAAELWMKDIEPVVGSSDYGKDEDMAEVRKDTYM